MSEHARHAPSSASRRRACPGSLIMSERYPETEETEAAKEGTAAHEVMAHLLEHARQEALLPIGHVCSNGVQVTEEMQLGASLIARDVWAVMLANPGGELRVEQRVDISVIHKDCWGTADVSYYVPGRLWEWDYKFGHGFVEVYENWQLIEYVAGELERIGINGMSDQMLTVSMRIVQPRCYHPEGQIREWKVTAADLRGHFNEARSFEAAAAEPMAPLTVSEECDYCPARHACTALQHAALKACDRAAEPNPFDLPAEALGREAATLTRAAEMLNARLTSLNAQIEAKLRAGESVPFWALGRGQGKTRWNVPVEQVAAMGDLMEVDLRKPLDVVTPTQARTMKKVDPNIVNKLSEYIPGAVTVIREDPSLAKRVFGK
jgi:hypothetical protein